MRVCILGLGYVGAVVSACLARNGHRVVGVDLNETKVATLNAGRSPIVEPQLEELIAAGVEEGRLHATTDVRQAVADSDVSMICVGTPSQADGSLDLQYTGKFLFQSLRYGTRRPRGCTRIDCIGRGIAKRLPAYGNKGARWRLWRRRIAG